MKLLLLIAFHALFGNAQPAAELNPTEIQVKTADNQWHWLDNESGEELNIFRAKAFYRYCEKQKLIK